MTGSVDGFVILREFLVRSETYVFTVNLVQKDKKKMFTFFTLLLLQKWFVSCDVIMATGIKILMTSENDVLYIIRKKI